MLVCLGLYRRILNELRLRDLEMKDKYQEDYKKYLSTIKELKTLIIQLNKNKDNFEEDINNLEQQSCDLEEIVNKLESDFNFIDNSLKEENTRIINVLFNYKIKIIEMLKNYDDNLDNSISMLKH